MLGWFKRDVTVQLAPAPPEASLDQNGRRIAPLFPGLITPETATDDQKMSALSWAKDWCRYSGAVTEGWREYLNDALAGRRPKRPLAGDPEGDPLVVDIAVSALRQAAQRNRMVRTSRALPWAELRIGPVDPATEDCLCDVARSIAGKLIAVQDFPVLPLPGCTAIKCYCWSRQMTEAEARKRDI